MDLRARGPISRSSCTLAYVKFFTLSLAVPIDPLRPLAQCLDVRSASSLEQESARGLLGRLARGSPRRSKQEAILAHLQALLSTRLGESLSAPNLGLIDFADIVHSYPASMQVLIHAIRAMLSQYEPRLRGVTVNHTSSDDPLTLALEITAHLDEDGGAIHMRTELTASGRVHVSGS